MTVFSRAAADGDGSNWAVSGGAVVEDPISGGRLCKAPIEHELKEDRPSSGSAAIGAHGEAERALIA
ncbi:MAG: hypothetical protein R3D28_17530 [Geminicoccaceae bacterium]